MMKKQGNIIKEYGSYTLAFLAGCFLSQAGFYYLAGIVMIAEALCLYVHWSKEADNPVELRALFTLAWVGGMGISCFKLSKLQSDWHMVTWLCFFLIFIGFGIGYEWKYKEYPDAGKRGLMKDDVQAGRIFLCIIGLAVSSLLCFVFEAVKVGFIPLFAKEPHAYSYFHVSGVHYFTISCILIPAITILYLKVSKAAGTKEKIILAAANLEAVAIPILCVSRFQLLFAVGFAIVTYIIAVRTIRLRTLGLIMAVLIPVYVILTVFRHHDVAYLNGIFEMKYEKMPIFVTQPYMYVANNFENFNCMAEQLTEHSLGMRMLFPVFALTGLKFVFPQLTSTVVYLTKPELTTLTMFYDAYYDFGVPGVFLFAVLLGAAAGKIMGIAGGSRNPAAYLIYGQMAIYLGLAFFTTWFSNPTTWFWLILTGMMYLFVGYDKDTWRDLYKKAGRKREIENER